MIIRKAAGLRLGALGAAAGTALVLAACGSSSPAHATKSTSAKPAAATSSGMTISTAKGSAGTYLVGPSGRALYLFLADHNGKSACSGSCAQNWPPLTTTSTPKAAGGVNASDFGSIARTGGTKQVTYKGHPLYTFIGDTGPGMTTGQGSDAFGAKWWLVGPAGAALTGGGASSGPSTTSSGY
jgi:predicted lipoprotein with Yx(FWY)xxD motif